MRYILAKRHAPILAAFASANVLTAFDYDGTLAPIAPDPASAPMRRRTRQLLDTLAAYYPCVVISGRRRADLARCLTGIRVSHLAGNHGAEPWGRNAEHAAQVRQWRSQLEQQLSRFPGVVIEDKKYTLTIHFRHASERPAALTAIDRAIRTLRGVRTMAGKETVNLLPRGAVDKGDALERARRLLRCERVIYVGDDDTDEAAFAHTCEGWMVGVRIGLRRRSSAPYHLKNQNEVDTFLDRLIRLRRAHRNGH
jgi:trehalose 6-phosphate phosphatase